MIILVDYDNIRRIDKLRGLVGLVSHVCHSIGIANLSGESAVQIRLYGGWFCGSQTSRMAQALAAEVHRDFPRALVITEQSTSITITCRVEMAYSLLCDPSMSVTHTFRTQSAPPSLATRMPPYRDCIGGASCPLLPLHAFLRDASCTLTGCQVSPESILIRNEQKLVDSMLTVDLIHATLTHPRKAAVVTSDDDLLPGVRLALLNGAQIIHIHTISGRQTPAHYANLVAGTYSQVTL